MPPTFPQDTNSPSHQYALLLWAGLSAGTRRSYQAATQSYEHYCGLHKLTAWPASEESLGRWIATRAFGSADRYQGQIKPDTIQSYVSALRSYHVDLGLPTAVFKSPTLDRLIQGARSLFQGSRRERLPITRELLTTVTPSSSSIDDVNVNAAFKLAFAGFLRMGEFTHAREREADPQAFAAANLSRSDIKFATDHVTVRLKRSKTDRLHQGVSIIVAATDDVNCAVRALRELFESDPKPPHAPLFSLTSGGFPRNKLISILHQRLQAAGIPSSHYSGHSFRRGAAQQAKNNGILDEHIQRLGRWSSNAFRLYFNTSQSELFRLNRTFQTGRPPPFTTFVVV